MQLFSGKIGIIADDLTGACDTALQFFTQGAAVSVLPDSSVPFEGEPEDVQVYSVNCNSRHVLPERSQQLTSQWVFRLKDSLKVDKLYKKMDSTLRGHFGEECLAIIDAAGYDCAVVVPAYPDEGRRTVGGYQLLHGLPIEQTEVGRDPQAPVRQSHIPTLLQQQVKPELVGHIQLYTVLRGAALVLSDLNKLIEQGKKLIVIDATCDTDLEQIALAIEKAEKNASILPCGSAGFSKVLSTHWLSDNTDEEAVRYPLKEDLPAFIICGSTTELSRQQIETLRAEQEYLGEDEKELLLVDLSSEQLLSESVDGSIVDVLANALLAKRTVVLASAFDKKNVSRTFESASVLGLTPEQVAERIAKNTRQLIKDVLVKAEAVIVACGGDTFVTVCQALQLKRLSVSYAVEPNIALLQAKKPPTTDDEGGTVDNVQWLISKSGNFGTEKTLANIVRFVNRSL